MEEEKKEENKGRGRARRSRSMITHQAKARMLSLLCLLACCEQPHLALVTDDPCQLRAGRVVDSYLPLLGGWSAV
jgi:hypothetical protein